MKRLLKEPLLHFVLLGALLFIIYGLLNRGDAGGGKIVVTQGKIENLRHSFERVWQRPPTQDELDGLIQEYIREEVLSREAVALGLDRDDTIIRRRLRQKMEFIANDLAAQTEPDDTELERFLAKHPDLFRVEPRYTFRQVFLNPDRRGDRLDRDVEQMLNELSRVGANAEFQSHGDATLLTPEMVDVPAGEVTREFGEEFMRQMELLPEGHWHGPVKSGYGVHLVRIEKRTQGRIPKLAEVREQVAREWVDRKRRESNEQFYQSLLQRYTVTIERSESGEQSTAHVRP